VRSNLLLPLVEAQDYVDGTEESFRNYGHLVPSERIRIGLRMSFENELRVQARPRKL
jgi:hypothetical protein